MKKPDRYDQRSDPSPRWALPWRRPHDAAERPSDPADLGTCYGLELSLAGEPAPENTAAARRPSWIKRLTTRRPAST